MQRHFNTAGPCRPELHYMLPPERRLPEVRGLIEQQAYFVVHAPRQIGKTTALRALAESLTAEGRFTAVLVSMETGAAFPDDVGAAEDAILAEWRRTLRFQLPPGDQPAPWPNAAPGARIGEALSHWAAASARPLVVFLDEIDALRDAPLNSVLRQLRAGHGDRPRGFPWALALVGLRDVRDYKVASGGSERLQTASPFNIKVRSLTMREFEIDEVRELYDQHTADTGQAFESAAVERAFELTRGQPWLVNALANIATSGPARDRGVSVPVTQADVERARDLLVERQETHLDSLAARLLEPRVRAVIEPMILGDVLPTLPTDDLRFALDLGLVRQTEAGGLEVANPIYREIIARELSVSVRASLPALEPSWLRPDGRMDWGQLRETFVSFWLQHGEVLTGSSPYHEAAPHLVLMAFLHRVVNGGGRLEREYAIGSGRMDLCVEFRGERLGVEVKTWRTSDKARDPAEAGLAQLDAYLARIDGKAGWLVLFDQRAGRPDLPERLEVSVRPSPSGRELTLVRL
jgi:hypothetical protein